MKKNKFKICLAILILIACTLVVISFANAKMKHMEEFLETKAFLGLQSSINNYTRDLEFSIINNNDVTKECIEESLLYLTEVSHSINLIETIYYAKINNGFEIIEDETKIKALFDTLNQYVGLIIVQYIDYNGKDNNFSMVHNDLMEVWLVLKDLGKANQTIEDNISGLVYILENDPDKYFSENNNVVNLYREQFQQ